ncbi:hypothetical protein GIB67_011282 [Kingdonia uniflora]|uniref:Protein FAR1-RELATED SEQUENCE n=1 Tax=Kingdonia uniflora TaxID=39325 RepID=A0A7J7MNN6_9MAGN|nr:hypothetical protein GIB67_011282 [Kingdonia uniflora]
MEDSVDKNWSKVIDEESLERCENERIVYPFLAEASYEGQHFNTIEDARLWYERYRRGQSFSTKIRNSTKRPRSDDIDRAHFCCMSNDFSQKNLGNPESSDVAGNRRSSDKCGCNETININWNTKIDKYVLTSFTNIHNHKLVSPRNQHRMKVNKFFPEAGKNLTTAFELHNNLVFPNTKHRFCLWHITNKFPEKIGHAYREPSTFKEDIDSIMHNTYKAVEFEIKWIYLMKKHKLDDNVWTQGIFNIRQRWIPLWNKETFFVGMSSTGWSESTNNFFNGWLPITTGLYSFVTKYEAALIVVYERESAKDFASEHIYRQVGPHQALLKDAAKIYTRTMFHKLQNQFDQIVRFIAIERHVEGNVRQLTVKSHSGRVESFGLQIDLKKLTGNYGCKLFEYVELPCCHLLKVFSKYDIFKIPEAFIMTRWTIGANKFSRSYDESQLEGDNLRYALRHSHQSLCASNLFERASKMKESFDFAVLELEKLKFYLQNSMTL